jgi:CxxC motif-containing protein
MEEARIICTLCPRGCNIIVSHRDGRVEGMRGNHCPNGLEYARNEFTSPVRVLTSTVRAVGGELPLLPVKTRAPIPKGKLLDCMRATCSIEAHAPIRTGDVLCRDICGTGTDLIATRNLEVIAE